jgi:hypothetical protein
VEGDRLFTSADASSAGGCKSADSLVVYDIRDVILPMMVGSWRKVDTTVIVNVTDSTLWTKGYIQRVSDTLEAKAVITKAPHGTIEYEESDTHIQQVAVRESLAFVVTNKSWAEYRYPDKLRVLDIRRPENMRVVGELSLENADVSIAVDDRYLYVCDVWQGMRVFDAAALPDFREVGHYLKKHMELIGTAGGYVYAKLMFGGFQSFMVGTPLPSK